MPQSITIHHYAGRLQRLITLINELKTTPHQTPEALYTGLGIARAMFYKDCQVLYDGMAITTSLTKGEIDTFILTASRCR